MTKKILLLAAGLVGLGLWAQAQTVTRFNNGFRIDGSNGVARTSSTMTITSIKLPQRVVGTTFYITPADGATSETRIWETVTSTNDPHESEDVNLQIDTVGLRFRTSPTSATASVLLYF